MEGLSIGVPLHKVGEGGSKLWHLSRKLRLRRAGLRDIDFESVTPRDLRCAPNALHDQKDILSAAYVNGALADLEYIHCQLLSIPASRSICDRRLPSTGRVARTVRRLRRTPSDVLFLDGLACREVVALPRQGLTTALAETAVAEAADRVVLFGNWQKVRPHLEQSRSGDELHRTMKRRWFTRWGLRRNRALVVLDDCPPRSRDSEPDPVLLRFIERLRNDGVPFVLGIKLDEGQPSGGELGYLASGSRVTLKVRSAERTRIVDRWVELVEQMAGGQRSKIDLQDLRGWLSDRYFVYKGHLSILLWLVSRRVGMEIFNRITDRANRTLATMDEDTQALIEAHCVVASVRPAAVNHIFGKLAPSDCDRVAWWKQDVGGLVGSREVQTSPMAATLAMYGIADRCIRDGRAPALLDRQLGKGVGRHREGDRHWRLVFHGLVDDWGPATVGLSRDAKNRLKAELRLLAMRHGFYDADPAERSPNEVIAIAATARALGASEPAAVLYRQLLTNAPWIENVERPQWFWASLMIGLRDTSEKSLELPEARQALIECERLCEAENLPLAMALGLCSAIRRGVEQNGELSVEERSKLLTFAEDLGRRVASSQGTQRKGAHATARLIGGLSGSYSWKGLQRPNLTEAVQWAECSFASDIKTREDPEAIRWQDVIAHDLLGSLYRAEFERNGTHIDEADHHYRLALSAIPRRDIDQDWERQLNYCIRSCGGYGRWLHRRGDVATAHHWYDWAVRAILQKARSNPPSETGLAFLWRDRFLAAIEAEGQERRDGLIQGLEVTPPGDLRRVLESRLRQLESSKEEETK